MSRSVHALGSVAEPEDTTDDSVVLLALKTAFDNRPVVAPFPPHFTLERSIAAMRMAIADGDAEGRQVLDNVERELSASRVHFLIVREDGFVNMPRSAVLHDIATPREMRSAKGPKTVPAVSVEVQAYASVGGARR